MRIIRRSLHMGAAWLFLSVCLWAAGIACLHYVVPASQVSRVSMRFSPQNAPSFAGMERYYEEQAVRAQAEELPGSVTAWAEERNRQISAKEWNADAFVDVYYVDGNAADMMNLRLVAGGFPNRTDKKGIAMDVKTAVKLFGSAAPVGLSVLRGEQEYIVRGVFERPERLIAWGSDTGRGLAVFASPPAASGDAQTGSIGVQGAEFFFPAGASPDETKSAAMQLAGKMGLYGAVYTRDHSAGDAMLRQLAQLPGWVMMAVAMFMLLRTAYSQTRMMLRMAWRYARSRTVSAETAWNTMLRGLLIGLVLVLLAACAYLIARPEVSLPPSYIPTQWSDTGFWTKLVKRALMDHAERNALPIARPDAVKNAMTGWGALFTGASIISLYLLRASLHRVLGRPVAARFGRHPDEWLHPAARWDFCCYVLLLVSAVAPPLGLKLVESMGLPPSISLTVFSMQVLPAVMISVELLLRLWPSALWPLRFSSSAVFRHTAFRRLMHPGRLAAGKLKGLKFLQYAARRKNAKASMACEREKVEG